jgi:hypothetical protein
MRIVLSLVLLFAAVEIYAACNWNNPGVAPYRVGKSTAQLAEEALEKYEDILPWERECLLRKIVSGNNDATLFITRDGIYSSEGAATNMRDMNYAKGKICEGPVLREKWSENHEEPALLYSCGHARVGQAVVCGNFFRVDFERKPKKEPEFRSWKGATPKFHPYTPPDVMKKDHWLWYRGIPDKVNEVPEPGTLSMVVLGIVLLIKGRLNGIKGTRSL